MRCLLSKMPMCVVVFLLCGAMARAQPDASPVSKDLARLESSDLITTAIGVTRRGTPIDAAIAKEDLDFHTKKTRVLLVAGASGTRSTVDAAIHAVSWFYSAGEAAKYRDRFALSVVPCVNPDGLLGQTGPADGSQGDPTRGFPPQGNVYNSKTDPESAYSWRWIGMHAPDLVIDLRPGEAVRWKVPTQAKPALKSLTQRLSDIEFFDPNDGLVSQLAIVAPGDVGTIPAMQVSISGERDWTALKQLLDAAIASNFSGPSPARREQQRRLARSPREISRELLKHYGQQLKQVVYIQSLAVIGRMRHIERVAAADQKDPNYAPIDAIVREYVEGGKIANLKSGSDLSGHLVFSEIAARLDGPRRDRFIELARRAADLAFDDSGKMQPVMPFHHEMSDSLFMGGPILAQVGQLTGETKYFDACARHLEFLRDLDFREDHLYRHSPLDEAAWGRGNGFPAIGVAMCLDAFPHDHPARAELLDTFQKHMAALIRHQDPTGCWHQVVDHPESYREFTSTCMITYAMIRGVSEKWLDEATYKPVIDKAWYAIRTRIGSNGELVDVCAGTGKQKSLRDYFDRTAILGRDDRGGAMALLVANEIDRWQQQTTAATSSGGSR